MDVPYEAQYYENNNGVRAEHTRTKPTFPLCTGLFLIIQIIKNTAVTVLK
jgi:hypothetical protein